MNKIKSVLWWFAAFIANLLLMSTIILGLLKGGELIVSYLRHPEPPKSKIFTMQGIDCHIDTSSCWVCVGDTYTPRFQDTPKEPITYNIVVTDVDETRVGFINKKTGKFGEIDFAVMDGFCRVFRKVGVNEELLRRLLE